MDIEIWNEGDRGGHCRGNGGECGGNGGNYKGCDVNGVIFWGNVGGCDVNGDTFFIVLIK